MPAITDDLRIAEINELISPEQLIRDIPVNAQAAETVAAARRAIGRIIQGEDDRLLAIVGPCSIHDPAGAIEYADKLQVQAQAIAQDVLVVMRVYFENLARQWGGKA